MKNKLVKILQAMGRVAFTHDEKADYLLANDVVPVVRCKDCAYANPYMTSDGKEMNFCHKIICKGLNPDDFCSYGERRQNNG